MSQMYDIMTVITCDCYPVLEYIIICSRFEVWFSSEQLNKPYSRKYNLYQSGYSLPIIHFSDVILLLEQ